MESLVTRQTATCGVNEEVCFSGDVFDIPRLVFFVILRLQLYGCVHVIVCYESMPMIWGTER